MSPFIQQLLKPPLVREIMARLGCTSEDQVLTTIEDLIEALEEEHERRDALEQRLSEQELARERIMDLEHDLRVAVLSRDRALAHAEREHKERVRMAHNYLASRAVR